MAYRPNAWDDIQIEYVNKIIRDYGIKRFFETGTYHGQTSLYFCMNGLDVYTVENNQNSYLTAKEILAGSEIKLFYNDSRQVLKDYVEQDLDEDTLFYLDAHWGDNLPLTGELEILDKEDKFVVVCHDVLVPFRTHFKWDKDVSDAFHNFKFTKPTTKIYPRYNIPMKVPPYVLCGYVILLRDYPMIMDKRFIFEEVIYP